MTQAWTGYAGDVAKSTGDRRAARRRGRRAARSSACAASAARWWAPGRRGRRRASASPRPTLAPVVLDPLFNRFTPLPAGPTARRRARARAPARRGRRRRGLRDGRLAPHDRGERLRRRASGARSGWCSTTTCWRTSRPGEVRLVVAHELGHVHHRDVPHGLLFLRSSPRSGCSPSPAWGSGWRPRDSLGTAAAVPAVVLAVGLAGARDHDDLQPALARRRGARGRVRARAGTASRETFIALPEADRDQERLRPRPARGWRASCSAPTRRRSSGSAAPSASSASGYASGSGPRGGASGRFLIPSGVRHLD